MRNPSMDKQMANEQRCEDRTPAPGTGDSVELRDEERTRCEIWTRVMGYHRPVSAWNPGKQSEHAERRYYAEPVTSERPSTAGTSR